MTMWKYIRVSKGKSIKDIVEETGISRQVIYLFENGKNQSIRLKSYYLRLNGRDIDNKIADILDNDYDVYYKGILENK